jgi:hypothetical protein
MPEDVEVLTTDELKLPNEVQAQLRIARKSEKENEALKAQITQMERHSAILAAGVPEHPAREVVFANYDGPLDGDSIRAHAEKMGIVAQESATQVTPQEQEAQRQILNAGGGSPPSSGDIDLAVALRNAKSQAEVMAIVREVSGNPGFRSRDGLIGEMPPPI